MNELALFAGGGGGILGGSLLGWTTVCACEIEPYPRNVLLQRQRDGILPNFPIWDDVCTFDGTPWRGLVDVVSGGFPCQDISCAGKGAGISGSRSGLWREMYRIVCEVRPRYVFVENSPMLVCRGLSVVLGDLAKAGYDAAWCVLGAADLGAPHKRDRVWILAEDMVRHTDSGHETPLISVQGGANPQPCGMGDDGNVAHPDMPRREKQRKQEPDGEEYTSAECCGWWSAEPGMGRVADGVAHRVDRLKALGNGQVPLVAAVAFKRLEQFLLSRWQIG